MKITLEMPDVSTCTITDCAYNVNEHCHARAITIGDGANPGCDTYLTASHHSRNSTRVAGVGACKVVSCRYNDDFECMSNHISVAMKAGEINCITFKHVNST
ncbi:MAG: DUF1540 domain-containing protein [Ectothiorhodospiraceae bacterium]|nr:DUF1540 domain-containing protein [Ectothiorhodospiraceae bacterium]